MASPALPLVGKRITPEPELHPPGHHRFEQSAQQVLQVKHGEDGSPVAEMHTHHFRPAAVGCCQRLGRNVDTEVGPWTRMQRDRRDFSNPHPEIVVHCIVEGRIKRTHHAPELAAEEHCLLGNGRYTPAEALQTRPPSRIRREDLSRLVDVEGLAVYHADRRVISQVLNGLTDRPRKISVIRIQPGKHVTLGYTKALVYRRGLSLVGFRGPIGESILEPPNDLLAAIRGPTIDDNVLDPWVILIQDRANRLFQESTLI